MSFNFNLVKRFAIEESEMIYDTQYHPTKDNIIAVSTIEGDLKMYFQTLFNCFFKS